MKSEDKSEELFLFPCDRDHSHGVRLAQQAPLSTKSSRLIFSYRQAMSLKRPEASDPLKLELAVSRGCWEPNSGTLQEKHMLFTADWSLQARNSAFLTLGLSSSFLSALQFRTNRR